VLGRFLKYRTYHGCALPLHTQAASTAAWRDEAHVKANRELYRQKFEAVLAILQPMMKVERPDAGFYLWAETPGSDTDFTKQLFAEQNVTVLPGSYLSREAHGSNPGAGRVRMALVAELDECIEAAERIREFVEKL
jgi:N-succinyldiaminopimelate aminotransferase